MIYDLGTLYEDSIKTSTRIHETIIENIGYTERKIMTPYVTRAFREFIIPLKKAPLLPISQSRPLPLPVLAQFYFLFIRKKGILPGLIPACYELKSNARPSLQFLTPSPLNTFRLCTIPFLPFHTRYFHLAGIFRGNF